MPAVGFSAKQKPLGLLALLSALSACQSRPTPVVDTATRPGETAPLTNEEIEAVIGSQLADMKTCFARLLVEKTEARGVLTLRWVVEGDGEVADVETLHSDFDAKVTKDLARCLQPKVSNLPFPATRGKKALRVTYPFVVK